MHDPRLDKLANVLTTHSTKVQPDEFVLIEAIDIPQEVEASANYTEKLNAILDTDGGARYIGEFAIAFNPYITNPMLDILFDEKIAGSFHFTLYTRTGL